VRRKLNPLTENIAGKRLVGWTTTSCAARSGRSSACCARPCGRGPPAYLLAALALACFYGIDTPSHEELLATDHSGKEMARILGADSLAYITIREPEDAIGADGFLRRLFTGNYPTPVPASGTLRRPNPSRSGPTRAHPGV